MPGPMVVERVTLLRYCPFADDGFALTITSRNLFMFSTSFWFSNSALPTESWTMPVLSTRNSILPALTSPTALTTSGVTVPLLGSGSRPGGPRTLPSLPTSPMTSGEAMITSMSAQPPWIFSTYSCRPAWSAPAARASLSLGGLVSTRTLTALPIPWGRATVPLIAWSAFLGSTPSRTAISTDSLNFAVAVSFTSATASSMEYFLLGATLGSTALNRLLRCIIVSSIVWLWCDRLAAAPGLPRVDSIFDGDAHAPGRAGHHVHGGVDVVCVEGGELALGGFP